MMLGRRPTDRLAQTFSVGDKLQFGAYPLSSGGNTIVIARLDCHSAKGLHVSEALRETMIDLVQQNCSHRTDIAALNRLFGCRDHGAVIDAGRLEAIVTRSFAYPMKPHNRFDEGAVG